MPSFATSKSSEKPRKACRRSSKEAQARRVDRDGRIPRQAHSPLLRAELADLVGRRTAETSPAPTANQATARRGLKLEIATGNDSTPSSLGAFSDRNWSTTSSELVGIREDEPGLWQEVRRTFREELAPDDAAKTAPVLALEYKYIFRIAHAG